MKREPRYRRKIGDEIVKIEGAQEVDREDERRGINNGGYKQITRVRLAMK